jgi:sphinganine-1-phosphate aldolase
MKAHRDYGYEKGIRHPEIIVPVTAHAAFDKVFYFFINQIGCSLLEN